MGTKKRQFSFHADDDVAEFLDSLESGLKTKRINEFIRLGMQFAGEQSTAVDLDVSADMDNLFQRINGIAGQLEEMLVRQQDAMKKINGEKQT